MVEDTIGSPEGQKQQGEHSANQLQGGQDHQDKDSDTRPQKGMVGGREKGPLVQQDEDSAIDLQKGSAEETEESAGEDDDGGETSDSSGAAEDSPLLVEPKAIRRQNLAPNLNQPPPRPPDVQPPPSPPPQENQPQNQNQDQDEDQNQNEGESSGEVQRKEMSRSKLAKLHTPLYISIVLCALAGASLLSRSTDAVTIVCGLTYVIVFIIGAIIFMCEFAGFRGAMFLLPHSVLLPMLGICAIHRCYTQMPDCVFLAALLALVLLVPNICSYVFHDPNAKETLHDYDLTKYRNASIALCGVAFVSWIVFVYFKGPQLPPS